MAFGFILWRDRNATFHPEDPCVVDKDIDSNGKFTFIDVIPGVTKKPSFGFPARRESFNYHPFSALIDTANDWLSKNKEWEVINCETVLVFFKFVDNGWQLAPQDTCFPLDGDSHSCLMALRLWLKRRDEYDNDKLTKDEITEIDREETENKARKDDECKLEEKTKDNIKAQVLKYIDFIPKKDDDNDNRFEKLESVIDRVNCYLNDDKIKGKIITIETLYFPSNAEWIIDSECTLHVFPSRCVSIIRLFYEETDNICNEMIGFQDFVPKHISGGGIFKKPSFEPLSECIHRASLWLSQNCEYDFKNAQCLEVKLKSLSHIETNQMSHTTDRGDYLRIFRVAYTKYPNNKENNGTCILPIYLTSIIFTPGDPETTITEMKRKLQDWVEKALKDMRLDEDNIEYHPRLLSAETVEIFTKDFSEEEIKSETENTFQYNRIGTMNCFLYMAFRVYFDVGNIGRRMRSKSITSSVSSQKHENNCTCV